MDDSVLMKMVWDRKKKASPTVEGRVELRITYHRKQKYILTSVSVLPCHWKSGMVVGRRDAYELNESLAILMKNVRQVVNDMQEAVLSGDEQNIKCDLNGFEEWLKNNIKGS